MNIKLITWNVRGLNNTTNKKLVKTCLQKWKADVVCLQETKVNKGIEGIAYQIWSSRWMRLGYIEGDGSKGGILIMWDSRVWTGTKVEEGTYSITCKFESTQNYFSWYFTGVYAPHTRKEKLECWEEMAAMKELWRTLGHRGRFQHCKTYGGKKRVQQSYKHHE